VNILGRAQYVVFWIKSCSDGESGFTKAPATKESDEGDSPYSRMKRIREIQGAAKARKMFDRN
jgi:hypothetical protein